MSKLSPHQQAIADAIISSKAQDQTLAGLAGTGKTTVAKEVFEVWTSMGLTVFAITPTGKAASVLSYKGVPAQTIHSLIYLFGGKYKDKKGETQLKFIDREEDVDGQRFIVDESSMVSAQQVADIRKRGIQTLWVGDPGQLSPVKSARTDLFVKPDHILREIHRQAAGNPVIKWAHALRKGAKIVAPFDGIGRVSGLSKASEIACEMIDRCIDRLIVRQNDQRVVLNRAVRKIMGKHGVLNNGDEIICCQNNKDLGVVNGDIFKVLEIEYEKDTTVQAKLLNLASGVTCSLSVWKSGFDVIKHAELDNDLCPPLTIIADYAYAITCHKFQGSSAPHVGIVPKGFCGGPDDERRWNYTAATRAEELVTVFC